MSRKKKTIEVIEKEKVLMSKNGIKLLVQTENVEACKKNGWKLCEK